MSSIRSAGSKRKRIKPFWLIIFVLFVTAQSCLSQKPTVILVGAIHHIPDSLKDNWPKFRERLEDYKPDAICIEYRIPSDTVSILQAGGVRYFVVLDSLREAWNLNKQNIQERIKELYQKLKKEDHYKERLELYELLYVTADIGNAHYQGWRAYNSISALTAEEVEKIRKEYPAYDHLKNLMTLLAK